MLLSRQISAVIQAILVHLLPCSSYLVVDMLPRDYLLEVAIRMALGVQVEVVT